MSLGQLHSAILKAAGYTVEGTTTRSVTGESKITAKLSGGFNLFGNRAQAEAGTEAAEGTGTQVESQPLELDAQDVNDIIAALEAAGSPHFIVLEDFHYLPEETQKDFAVALKAFHEDSNFCFIIVGVWLDQNRLVQQNGDLTGRVVSVDADKWSGDELLEVIEGGERLLNVSFSEQFKEDLLDGCFESIYVVQESCRRACEGAEVYTTAPDTVTIDAVARDLIKEAVDAHTARYTGIWLQHQDRDELLGLAELPTST